ncbi:MAG TPA: uracil-DNA glycosylase [Pyrinomonadaceae bacterium]|jgi:DNA polymerase
MKDDSPASELLALMEETGEYLSYLRELGVETAAEEAASVEQGQEASMSPPARTEGGASAAAPVNHAALRRHASVAAQRLPPPSNEPAQEADASLKRAASQQQTDMAKRTTKKYPDPVPPPPQETLFGEITPKDEESLPRTGETLEDIRADIGECMRCPLCQSRTRIVHSEGNPQARLMFVGEAPGADEDATGRPFVGRAGQLLNKIIEAIGMKREDVMIGNVNRCRPPQNRTPTGAEAATCKPFLLREIAIIQPEVIVVLGNTAMKNLLDTKEGITKLRGNFQDYRGIKVMPTFHPAYLLRDPSKKREAWEDMKKVRDYLDGKLKL